MSSPRASLLRNVHVRGGGNDNDNDNLLRARHFITRNPPHISPKTRVVAVAHPSVRNADPEDDGWFISDFYAFNYLLKGQGRSQVWLTAAEPLTLIEKYGDYLHGNPFQDRKVVLSKKLLDSGELTQVTVVHPNAIIDCFLEEVKAATEEAKRDEGVVLLLVFCHGTSIEEGNEKIVLDDTGAEKLSIARLQAALAPDVSVCLLTPVCSPQGGWSVSTDINIPTVTTPLHFWPKSTNFDRALGTVFAGEVIAALVRTADLFPEDDNEPMSVMVLRPRDDDAIRCVPELDTPEQVATYDSFCKSIWESCQSCQGLYRGWQSSHNFLFGAQGDEREEPWTQMTEMAEMTEKTGKTGMALEEYGARWERLDTVPYIGSEETKAKSHDPDRVSTQVAAVDRPSHDPAYRRFVGPFLESIRSNDLVAMVELWRLNTCPGDDVAGWGPRLGGFMQRCVDTGKATPFAVDDLEEDEEPEPDLFWDVVEILKYRWNMAALAEDILDSLELPRPGGHSCIMWNRPLWERASCIKYSIRGDPIRGDPIRGDSARAVSINGISFNDVDKLREKIGLVSYHFSYLSCRDKGRSGLLTMIGNPGPKQGPIFHRILPYLTAGITEGLYQVQTDQVTTDHASTAAAVSESEGAEATQDRALFLATAVLDRLQGAILFHQHIALNNPEVRRRGREWAVTMPQ